MTLCTRSKSSQRNSSHSVTSTTASAPVAASYGVGAQLEAGDEVAGLLARAVVVRPYVRTFLEQATRDEDRGRVAQVVGVGLEREAPQPDGDAGETSPPHRVPDLVDHALVLGAVHVDDTGEQLEVVPGRARDVQQRRDVLREARAAVARSGVQELEPDAGVVTHADRDFADVGVDRLADVRDGVDERDLRREERVRGVLDHLRRRGVGDEHRRVDPLVELADAHGRLAVFAADHDAVGVQEVADGLALAQEFGVRGHGHIFATCARLGQDPLHEARRPDRHRRLVDDDGAGHQHRSDLPGDCLHEGEVGRTVGSLRRLHAQEHDFGGPGRGGGADHELEPLRREPLLDQLGKAHLEDGNFALFQASDPIRVDVGALDVVTEVREAGGGREADIAGTDDRDPHDAPRAR